MAIQPHNKRLADFSSHWQRLRSL